MSKSTDERGRLYLPKEIRERFGDRYRIVELPSHVALFPVDDDPLAGLRDAVGDAFDGEDVDALHAGIAATGDGTVLSSERDYDTVGLDGTPLEPDEG